MDFLRSCLTAFFLAVLLSGRKAGLLASLLSFFHEGFLAIHGSLTHGTSVGRGFRLSFIHAGKKAGRAESCPSGFPEGKLDICPHIKLATRKEIM
jgi:hypothetical protein